MSHRLPALQKGVVMDNRHAPFCWQGIHAMTILREHYTGSARSTAISVYQAFTEVANEHRDRASFAATRKRIAELAGVHVDTLDDYVVGLQTIGLIGCQKRKSGTKNLPNIWTLTDPEGVAVSDRQGGGVTPLGGGGVTPPVKPNKKKEPINPPNPPDDLSPSTVTAEETEAASTAVAESRDRSRSTNGNKRDSVKPDQKKTTYSSAKITTEMRKAGAWDWKIQAVCNAGTREEVNAAFAQWRLDGTVPGRGGTQAPKRSILDELGLR